MTVQLARPWSGDPPITQQFGVTDFSAEPPGYLWSDNSISYYTPGGTRYPHLHCGLDLGLGMGAPLTAPADGVVEVAGWDSTGFGNCTKIRHDALGIGTLYGHQSEIDVQAGQTVKAGQLIGKVGSTGLSTAAHLHFSVYRLSDKHYVDPAPYLTGTQPTPPPQRPPQPPNRYHPVRFTVVANSDGHPVNTFAGPSHACHCTGQIAAGTKIQCLGYINSDAAWDDTVPSGQWDTRWVFTDAYGWVSSARVQGNPPNSSPV